MIASSSWRKKGRIKQSAGINQLGGANVLLFGFRSSPPNDLPDQGTEDISRQIKVSRAVRRGHWTEAAKRTRGKRPKWRVSVIGRSGFPHILQVPSYWIDISNSNNNSGGIDRKSTIPSSRRPRHFPKERRFPRLVRAKRSIMKRRAIFSRLPISSLHPMS